MEVTGILKAKFDAQQVSDKFKNRQFVLTTEANTKYPQQVNFQLVQDKCTLVDTCNIGDELRIQFNLRGREWVSPQGETKYFNTLEAWKIEKLVGNNNTQQNSQPQTQHSSQNSVENTSPPVFSTSVDDDLPF